MLTLKWVPLAQSHQLAWIAQGTIVLTAPALPTFEAIAAVVGPPGRDGDAITQLDLGTF